MLPLDDLKRIELYAKRRDRTAVLGQYLRRNSPDAVRLFLKELEESFVYMDFRGHLSSPIVEALRSNMGRMSEKAQVHAKMLLILAGKDPVAGIIKLLDEPEWKDKNLALFELARLRDRRAVAPIARILHKTPAGYFHADSELEAGMAVQHALEAIANAESREAVSTLIGLLPVDLSRFGTYIDRDGFRRIIAAHLIELTGESFGSDADAWRKWNEERR